MTRASRESVKKISPRHVLFSSRRDESQVSQFGNSGIRQIVGGRLSQSNIHSFVTRRAFHHSAGTGDHVGLGLRCSLQESRCYDGDEETRGHRRTSLSLIPGESGSVEAPPSVQKHRLHQVMLKPLVSANTTALNIYMEVSESALHAGSVYFHRQILNVKVTVIVCSIWEAPLSILHHLRALFNKS